VRDDRASGDATSPVLWFACSSDRESEHAQTHLANLYGVPHADSDRNGQAER
jgi:hypothetical protein